jgi:hypothetical protein
MAVSSADLDASDAPLDAELGIVTAATDMC